MELLAPPKIGIAGEFGDPVSVTISQNPEEFSDKFWRESEVCPVCGETTAASPRLSANLYPTFSNGLSFGMGVWVHSACFYNCPDSGEPAPVPW